MNKKDLCKIYVVKGIDKNYYNQTLANIIVKLIDDCGFQKEVSYIQFHWNKVDLELKMDKDMSFPIMSIDSVSNKVNFRCLIYKPIDVDTLKASNILHSIDTSSYRDARRYTIEFYKSMMNYIRE